MIVQTLTAVAEMLEYVYKLSAKNGLVYCVTKQHRPYF